MPSINPIHNARLNYISYGAQSFDGALVKDSYLSVEFNSDLKSITNSFDGRSICISVLPDDGAMATLNLDYQSPVNAYLHQMVAEEKRNGTVFALPLEVATEGTQFGYKLKDAIIMKRPSQTLSQDMAGATQTWELYCTAEELPLSESSLNVSFKASIQSSVSASIGLSAAITL